jgi:hypothetical protein
MNAADFRKKCRGVVAVQFCPYTEDRESVDLDALEKNTRFLVEFSQGGRRDIVVFTNGSTTEFYANSLDEQKSVIETVVETVDGVIPVIAGVSQAGTRETVKMARYAEEVGFDGFIASTLTGVPYLEGVWKDLTDLPQDLWIAAAHSHVPGLNQYVRVANPGGWTDVPFFQPETGRGVLVEDGAVSLVSL